MAIRGRKKNYTIFYEKTIRNEERKQSKQCNSENNPM